MNDRRPVRNIGVIALLLILAILLFVIFGLIEKIVNRMNEVPESPGYTDSGDSRVFYDGEWYRMNDNLETILVLGIDSIETPDGGREDSAQADFVVLLLLDKLDRSFRILHINRDTMTEIPEITGGGEQYGTFKAQLALAHTYGSTGEIRCRNTVQTVENLLYGIRIDHYFSLTMDAIPIIADGVGGVTVTLENDFPLLGEEYVKGATVTLKGEDALTFVRYRNDEATTSNLERMERQRLFIGGLFEKYAHATVDSTLDTVTEITEYFVSDCTASQISNLIDRMQLYEDHGVQALPGEAKLGKEYVEFHVDEEALRQVVIDHFYKICE